jgi:hypothetical protein
MPVYIDIKIESLFKKFRLKTFVIFPPFSNIVQSFAQYGRIVRNF